MTPAEMSARLDEIVSSIGAVDVDSANAARSRIDSLTKPVGSLGVLEDVAVRLAGIQGTERPAVDEKSVIVMAADHGVAKHGVSAYPSEVTVQMISNFLAGGGAINVLARQAGARISVVDTGVASELPDHPNLIRRNIAAGRRRNRDRCKRVGGEFDRRGRHGNWKHDVGHGHHLWNCECACLADCGAGNGTRRGGDSA